MAMASNGGSDSTPPLGSPPRRSPPFPLCFDPQESPGGVQRTARFLEGEAREMASELQATRRKLQDLQQDPDAPPNTGESANLTARKRGRDANEENDGPSVEEEAEAAIFKASHQFGILYCVFLKGGPDTFRAEIPPSFDANNHEHRFANEQNMIRGQLHDVLQCLPEEQHSLRRSAWFGRQFCHSKRGLGDQRSNTNTRLRRQIDSAALGVTTAFGSSDGRREYREKIGYNATSESYSILDVPILHSGKDVSKYDPMRFLRSETVMRVFVAMIRGPEAAKYFKPGRVYQARTLTAEKMYRIRHITPHAIANAGMLTVWLFSSDVTLSEVGDVTTINYLQYYESYLEIILKGLNNRAPSIRGLIRAWDAAIFPMSDSSILKSSPKSRVANRQVLDALAGMDEEVPEPASDEEGSGVNPEERRDHDDNPCGPSEHGQNGGGGEQPGDNAA